MQTNYGVEVKHEKGTELAVAVAVVVADDFDLMGVEMRRKQRRSVSVHVL